MAKILMKHVPIKIDKSIQHKVMRNWSESIVESHSTNKDIRIISVKELQQELNKQMSKK